MRLYVAFYLQLVTCLLTLLTVVYFQLCKYVHLYVTIHSGIMWNGTLVSRVSHNWGTLLTNIVIYEILSHLVVTSFIFLFSHNPFQNSMLQCPKKKTKGFVVLQDLSFSIIILRSFQKYTIFLPFEARLFQCWHLFRVYQLERNIWSFMQSSFSSSLSCLFLFHVCLCLCLTHPTDWGLEL